MNDIMTLDESFFDEGTPTITQKEKVVESEESKNGTVLPEQKAEPEISFLSLEDLEAIDNDGIEVSDEDVTKSTITSKAEIKKEVATPADAKSKLYASQIEYFKEKGLLPEGFELEDGVSWDEDTFEEALEIMAEGLHNNIETDVRGEFESKLGTNVIKFLENGGDYSTFAELIKEQSVIQNLDITSDNGQKAVVKKYYVEVLEWSEAKIDRHIDRLYNDGELEEEAVELKSKFDKYFAEEQDVLIQQQEAKQQRQEKALGQRKNTFGQALQDTGFVQRDISSMVDYVFTDAYQLPNGTKIPRIDYDILMMQKNPKELADLVQFITDKDGYLKKKATEINNVKVDKKFKEIVQNQVTIKGGSNQSDSSNKPKSKFKTRL